MGLSSGCEVRSLETRPGVTGVSDQQTKDLERQVRQLRERLAQLEGELLIHRGQLSEDGPGPTPVGAMSSVDQYRELIENLHAGLVVHASDTSILLCNGTSSELLGLSMDQMMGKTVLDPAWCFLDVAGDPMPLEHYPVNKVIATGAPLRNHVVGINRPLTGDLLWVLCNAYPVCDAAGVLQQVVVTFIDVTDQRRAEEEKGRLEEQLRQTQRMESVGQLAGGIAHDFNNLLTAILGTCDLIDLGDPEWTEGSRGIDEIRLAANKAAALTRQLLAFSRKQVLQPRRLDLNRVVGGMERMLRRLIGEHIEFVTVLSPVVGPVVADRSQIEQVVMNLAVNARDALTTGGRIVVETRDVHLDESYAREHAGVDPGRYAALCISDDGVGMSPEVRARAFEPFFTTKEVGRGTGLGLATVHGVVNQSGGHVWLYSELGEGTTFKIYLPVDDGPLEATAEVTPILSVDGTETILVVEDEPTVRTLASAVLRRHGYRVYEATGPDEAIRMADRMTERLDLLLTDVVMPRASGLQLARQLTLLRPDLKVLYMTGYTDNAIVHHGALDVGTELLEKPFTADGLAWKVRTVLDAD
jgi:two-component system, cell cycle sensor histidine kinase and response regulator CckA